MTELALNPSIPSHSSSRNSSSSIPSRLSSTIRRTKRPRKISRALLEGQDLSTDSTTASGNQGPQHNNSGGSASNGEPLPDDWFAIKDIIDERVERRRRYYLVDWANHPETGESYAPSWVRYSAASPSTP